MGEEIIRYGFAQRIFYYTDLIYKLVQYFSIGIYQTLPHKSFTKFQPTHIGLKWNPVWY